MVDSEIFRQIALSFPETSEHAHFEKQSYKIAKKIFATLDLQNHQASLKLSERDQSIFSAFDKTIIFPVPNQWGKQGWTSVDLQKVPQEMLVAILKTAYCQVAPKKLAALIEFDSLE